MQEGGPASNSGTGAPPVAALAAAAVAAAAGQAAAAAGSSSPSLLYPTPQQIAAQQQHIAAAAHAHNMGVAAPAAAASSGKLPVLPPGSLPKPHPAVRLFENWMSASPAYSASFRPLHELPVEVLLSVIGDWIAEARKSNGGAYTPDTMYVYLSSLQRHIRRTHGQPHFNFLESLPVRMAMEKKFGAEALAHIMQSSGSNRNMKREAASVADDDDGEDDADSTGEAAAAGDKSEQHPKPHFPPLLSRKRNRKGKAGAAAAFAANHGGVDIQTYTNAVKRTAAGAAAAATAAGNANSWMTAMGLTPTPSTDAFLTPAVLAAFKPPKPSHSHRSFRTEQRLLGARQDPSTPEGLLRCLLWIMFTHVPNLTKNACWALKVNQFVVRTMQGDGSDVRDAPEQATGDEGAAAAATATGEGKTIRFLQFTQTRKMMRASQGGGAEGPPEIIMYEQPTMRHCCPVTLYQQYMAHRPHRAIEISNVIRKSMSAEKPPGEETDAGSFLWLLTRKHLETSGDDAGVWYANRRVGQATMDKLIVVVRSSRNQPPLSDHDALAARAERIDMEDQEESAEINITTGEEATDDAAAEQNKRAKMPNQAASASATAASSSSAAAAAAAPSFPPFPSASPADLARLGLVFPPNPQLHSAYSIPGAGAGMGAGAMGMGWPPGMNPMNLGAMSGAHSANAASAAGEQAQGMMMRQNLAYNLQQAMASQAQAHAHAAASASQQHLGALSAPNAAMASMSSAFPWAAAAAAASGASAHAGSQQVQLAEQALMKKIMADRAESRGSSAANAAGAAASSVAAAAAASSSPPAAAASSKLKSASNGTALSASLPLALGAESLPSVHEYLRTYGAHLRELKETVAALEASLARVTAMITTGATSTAAIAASSASPTAATANAAPAAAAASRGEEDGEDAEEEEEEMDQEE